MVPTNLSFQPLVVISVIYLDKVWDVGGEMGVTAQLIYDVWTGHSAW